MAFSFRSLWATILCLATLLGTSSLPAADQAFVGVLAIAVEPAVAEQLVLSEEVKQQLLALIDKREAEALEIVQEIKDLPFAERAAKLAPFVAESEKQGLALLSEDQKKKLAEIRISRMGMAGLADPQIVKDLDITRVQQLEINKIVTEYQSVMSKGSEGQKQIAKAFYERKLAALLTPEQKTAWDKLAGTIPAAAAPPVVVPAGTVPSANPPANVATAPAPMPMNTQPAGPTKPADPAAPASVSAPDAQANPSGLTATDAPKRPVGDVKLRFNFRFAPWKDVLDWFATQADLSLIADNPPPGTFNYSDSRSYTPAEAIDLLNGVLLTKGHTLIRRERMLMLINLEDGIPSVLVPVVPVADLEKKGDFELVSAVFQMTKLTPEEAEAEVRKLLGPQGSVVVLAKAKQLYVTETAGKLRVIRTMFEAIENPEAPKDDKYTVVKLKNLLPSEFMALAKPLLGIPDNANATPDGSIRLAVDEPGSRVLVSGRIAAIEKVQELVKLIDVEEEVQAVGPGILEQPQLEVYRVSQADPTAVLQVLQTMLAGLPDVRMTVDPKTGNLVALAKPGEHKTIRATLDQLQRDGTQVEVIKLRKIDPSAAVLAINKLFGDPTGKDPLAANAPKIDADPINMQLMIRGNANQVGQIRELLTKMGEVADGGDDLLTTERSTIRMLPLTGRSARTALEQIEQVWQRSHANKIRFVTPANPSGAPSSSATPEEPSIDSLLPFRPEDFGPRKGPAATDSKPAVEKKPAATEPAPATKEKPATPGDRRTQMNRQNVRFVAFQNPAGGAAETKESKQPVGADEQASLPSKPGAEIIVTVLPGGIMIESEDLDALDEFEQLLRSITDLSTTGGKEFTVFYLKFAKAEIAASLLQEMLAGGTGAPADTGGGGSLMGDLASSMMGDLGGGLLGGLLGLGGGGGGTGGVTTTGTVSVIPDPRLNALVVQAAPRDLDTIEQLLKVIDQPSGPEAVQTVAPPRFIPVINADAEEIAGVIKQVYSGRVQASGGGQQPQQPSPEEFIRALRGGSSRGGTGQKSRGEEQKMTIGVDAKSNSLIVSAPDYLFQEVRALVEHLDAMAVSSVDETVRVVTLKRTNSDLVQKSLSSMLGDKVTVNKSAVTGSTSNGTTASTSGSRSSSGSGNSSSGGQSSSNQSQPSPVSDFDQIRQRIEMFNQLQQRLQQGGGSRGGAPGGGFPGGGTAPGAGGFPGGSGRGGGGFPGGGNFGR